MSPASGNPAPGSPDALLRDLVQGDPDARMDAAELLASSGDRRAVGALVRALRDADADVRATVCEVLGGMSDPRAIAPLVSLLRDEDDDVRGEAFSALIRIGQARASSLPDYAGEDPRSPSLALTQIVWPADLEAVKLLHEALEDADPEVRIGALYALGRMQVAGAFDAIWGLLTGDADTDVRAAAAFAMGDLIAAGELRAISALVQVWPEATDPEMAVIIVRALAESGHPDAHPVLLAALRHVDDRVRQLAVMGVAEARAGDGKRPNGAAALVTSLRDPHVGVRRNAVYALGRLDAVEHIDDLVGIVHANDAEVRHAVGEALARLHRASVREGLSRAAAGSAESRQSAAYLRGVLREPDGLIEALQDPEPEVRKDAALAMGNCADARFRGPLEGALTDDAWRVRVAGAEGLRRLGDPRAVPALQACVDDAHAVVQNAVNMALRALAAAV
ncbi:MAG: HEAT repeat protein [Bradymonadia bacterium]